MSEQIFCDFKNCGYSSNIKYNLKRHKANIHGIDIKWFSCLVKDCGKKFKENCNLKQHMGSLTVNEKLVKVVKIT
jgi:uncharacterized Zn-finger protein